MIVNKKRTISVTVFSEQLYSIELIINQVYLFYFASKKKNA